MHVCRVNVSMVWLLSELLSSLRLEKVHLRVDTAVNKY